MDKIALCKRHPAILGRKYRTWDLYPQREAILVSADVDGKFILHDETQCLWEWSGDLSDFIYEWKLVNEF